jgi:hypothetical protein
MRIILRVLLLFLILYWGVFAFVTPVTDWDSHTYNIARIPLALMGGLFGNPYWNDARQAAFPWSFDALHLPFYWFGGGTSTPSYLCFIGTLAIVWTIVNSYRGADTATLCALAMFAIPTFVYQATSSKNDWAVVFGVACWFYFLWLYNRSPTKWLLWGLACSLGFTAGVKSAGLPLTILGALMTFYVLRRNLRYALQFSAALLLALVLWGSVETYVNNVYLYGYPLGPEELMTNKNTDGVRGGMANAIRYTFSSVNFGADEKGAEFLTRQGRHALQILRLRDLGYRSDLSDSDFLVLKKGWGGASDFGLLGFLALVGSVCILLRGAWRTAEWRLATGGFLNFGIVCISIGWTPWCLRYLMLSFLLFLLAGILSLQGLYLGRKPWPGWLLCVAILHGIAVYPLFSYNKSPRDLWTAIARREDATFKEKPGMQEVFDGVQNAVFEKKMAILFLHAGGNSWVLPFFQIEKLQMIPRPTIKEIPVVTGDMLHAGESAGLLVLNRSLKPDKGTGWSMYQRFAEPDTALYLWQNP